MATTRTARAQDQAHQATEFAAWFREADAAGKAAAEAKGTPEYGWRPTDLDGHPTGPGFAAPISGTAYLLVRPGNHPFVRFLKQTIGWHGFKGHYGGAQFSVRGYGQAFEPSMAYAEAFARVIRDHGVNVYTDSWVN